MIMLQFLAIDTRDHFCLLLNSSVWVIVSIPPLGTAASYDFVGPPDMSYNLRNRIMILTCSGKTICINDDGIARRNLAISPASTYDRTVLLDSYSSSVSLAIFVYFSDVLAMPFCLVLDPRIAFLSEFQMTARILGDRRLKSN